MGHVPGDDSGATRMQDEAGHAPADRRWSDVKSDARDDRLQTYTKCACMVASAITRARHPTPAYRAFAASRGALRQASPALDLATALPRARARRPPPVIRDQVTL